MNKEEYLKLKEKGEVTLEMLFEMYIELAKPKPLLTDFNTFQQVFIQYEMFGGKLDTTKVYKYYDNKFK